MNSIWAGQIHLLKYIFLKSLTKRYPIQYRQSTGLLIPCSLSFPCAPMLCNCKQLIHQPTSVLSLSLCLSLCIYISFFNPSENEPGRQKEKCVPKRDCILIATSLLPGRLIFSQGKNDVVPADHMLLICVCMVWFLTYHENYLMDLYVYVDIIAIFFCEKSNVL